VLISDNIKKLDNIWPPTKVLKYFYLSFNLQNDVEDLRSYDKNLTRIES